MNVHLIHVKMERYVKILSARIDANVQTDSKVRIVSSTSTIVIPIHASMVEYVTTLSMDTNVHARMEQTVFTANET
jgi:hypothetical protein